MTADSLDKIGNTPLVLIKSLSELSGNNIYLKCENLNPGGSIKDRAAKQMVLDGIENGTLKKEMTIIEGTAGNTGIGLAMVARELGYKMMVVMPDDQAKEKDYEILKFGAELKKVPAVPFTNPNHFFHTARRMAEEEPEKYWFANQFENLSNFKAHYDTTGPEIYNQLDGKVDVLSCAAGTGGTIAGTSCYLKKMNKQTKVYLVDPDGSGLHSYLSSTDWKSNGLTSITEGVGIMRLVPNFNQALLNSTIDGSFNISDKDLVTIANYVRANDNILLGSSSALNTCGAFKASMMNKGQNLNIVTFFCDAGERTLSKLYNKEFLETKNLHVLDSIEQITERFGVTKE
ncbi:cysteine synthase cysK [Acrasis kona]|uniref:Cysteine synthase cysK n=1 Tax=Acrasis kona TaxID=1008807 RepID=A0AAW2YU44_9EUKA